ncbi:MAG: SDR family NAD(P)-dependent oxidoreductase [Hyphomonadaceae bacterium JAD_PAG50586_4]|nr:MAG: SDR family NAD(P)-dependent oxidoreductase [Hyphomonadaceae bacterium JAD_PAG50586_4]
MSALPSLGPDYRAAVFGASGGIGVALVALLQADDHCAIVHAGSRVTPDAGAKLLPFAFDLEDEKSIAIAVQEITACSKELDLVIVATGLLHDDALAPEKTMRALNADALARCFAINAIGPALVAKHVTPFLPRQRKSVFAALSARVGSIADNRQGGWHGYRASKAALNQLIRTCAIEVATKNKHAIYATLHPGTVDTGLSRPFQAAVRPGQLFSAPTSAAHLLRVIDELTPEQSGQFLAWDAKPIPF